jgi:hypothetical protein
MARSCQLVYQSETVHCGPVLVCCSHLRKQKTGNLLDLSTLFPCRNTATYYIYESQNVWREFWKERDLGFKLESTLSLKQIKIQKIFTQTPKSLFFFHLNNTCIQYRKKENYWILPKAVYTHSCNYDLLSSLSLLSFRSSLSSPPCHVNSQLPHSPTYSIQNSMAFLCNLQFLL